MASGLNSLNTRLDPWRVIAQDLGHSDREQRYYCFGRIDNGIMGALYMAKRQDQDFWRRLLAERKGDL